LHKNIHSGSRGRRRRGEKKFWTGEKTLHHKENSSRGSVGDNKKNQAELEKVGAEKKKRGTAEKPLPCSENHVYAGQGEWEIKCSKKGVHRKINNISNEGSLSSHQTAKKEKSFRGKERSREKKGVKNLPVQENKEELGRKRKRKKGKLGNRLLKEVRMRRKS